MQRVVGGYLAKRIGDELFSAPARPTVPGPTADDDDPDQLVLADETGRPLGTAYRLPEVAVYVVSDGHGHRQDELAWCVADPEGRLFVQRDGGRITGLIYAPAPGRPPTGEGLRADEV